MKISQRDQNFKSQVKLVNWQNTKKIRYWLPVLGKIQYWLPVLGKIRYWLLGKCEKWTKNGFIKKTNMNLKKEG